VFLKFEYQTDRSTNLSAVGAEIRSFPLTRLIAYTTASYITTAVIRNVNEWINEYAYIAPVKQVFSEILWMPQGRIVWAVNGVDRSDGPTCSDAHEFQTDRSTNLRAVGDRNSPFPIDLGTNFVVSKSEVDAGQFFWTRPDPTHTNSDPTRPDPRFGTHEWPVTGPDPAQGQYDSKQFPDFLNLKWLYVKWLTVSQFTNTTKTANPALTELSWSKHAIASLQSVTWSETALPSASRMPQGQQQAQELSGSCARPTQPHF